MKARITFIHNPQDGFNPSQIEATKSSFHLRGLHAGLREDRLTFGLDELPKDVTDTLLQTHALHIRWQSPNSFSLVEPYSSRIAPGLHVHHTPSDQVHESDRMLCPLLKHLFHPSMKCDSINSTFVQAPALSEGLASSTSRQFYSLFPSNLDYLAAHAMLDLCSGAPASITKACEKWAAKSLKCADTLDADYDAIDGALTVRTLRAANSPTCRSDAGPTPWTETISALPGGARVEVGVLSRQDRAPGDDAAESVAMGGYIATIDDEDGDEGAKPTLFSFPSRHHTAPSPYVVSFNKPTGLHPTLRIAFPEGAPPPPKANNPASCRLHAYLTLPSHIFPDKYQLAAPNFLSANRLGAIRSLTSPPPDLEAPDWAVGAWGANLLMELAPPPAPASAVEEEAAMGDRAWAAEIPLHLRYLAPTAGGVREAAVPWPAVFWACASEAAGGKMAASPFDRTDLGFDAAFGPRTAFYHLAPQPSHAEGALPAHLLETIRVPVLDEAGLGFGQLKDGTAAVLLAGLAWVLWKLVFVSITGREAGSLKVASQRGMDKKSIKAS